MSPIITERNTADSLILVGAGSAPTTAHLDVIEHGTATFAQREFIGEVLPPRLWLSHSRALETARRGRPNTPTPEPDFDSDRR